MYLVIIVYLLFYFKLLYALFSYKSYEINSVNVYQFESKLQKSYYVQELT